jgi:hypothetical protein
MAKSVRVPAFKLAVVPLKAGTKFDAIVRALDRRFTALGCRGCLSGLNRLVIQDRIGSIIR